ncbi:MAG: hypothetical protein RR825_03265 [Ruthenibacterium sp.]
MHSRRESLRGEALKVAFYTLGCKVNQNETGALTRLFCENGFSLAQEDEIADVYIVNSCTVTAGGDKKSRSRRRPLRQPRRTLSPVPARAGAFLQTCCAACKRASALWILYRTRARRFLRSCRWSR